MRKLPTVMCVVALSVGCSKKPAEPITIDGLVITAADPETAIEARYTEDKHSLVLRSRQNGTTITAEIVDERGHSMTQLAQRIVERAPVRTPDGKPTISVAGLFENAKQLGAALRLSRHGLRRLRGAIPDAVDSALFRQLEHQTAVLDKALITTRLALLQEWGTQARSQLELTPAEHARFFAILNRQAALIAAPTKAGSPGSLSTEIAALLGPERYGHYQARRKAWLAPVGELALGVVP